MSVLSAAATRWRFIRRRTARSFLKSTPPMGDLTDFAAQICESIGKNIGHIAAVSDRDAVIAAYGVQRRELMDKHCSQELEQLMEARKIYRYQPGQAKIYPSDASERYYLGVSAPILSEGVT